MPIIDHLNEDSLTASTEYLLDPNFEHTFALSGSGTWQFWDGAAWKDFAESSGTSQGFIAVPPPSGRVQVAVTSGTVVVSVHRFLPRGIQTKGK